jgi:hypothetical protein
LDKDGMPVGVEILGMKNNVWHNVMGSHMEGLLVRITY